MDQVPVVKLVHLHTQPKRKRQRISFCGIAAFAEIHHVEFLTNQPPNEEGVHVGAIARAVGGDAGHIRSESQYLSWIWTCTNLSL